MPGTNLTRDEASTRAALLTVDSYAVELDLTSGTQTFRSTTIVTFDLKPDATDRDNDSIDTFIAHLPCN